MSDRDDCGGGAAGDPTKPSVDGVLDGVEFDDSTVVANVFFSVVSPVVVAAVVADVVDVPKRDGFGAETKGFETPKGIAGPEGAAVAPNRDGLGAGDCEDDVAATVPKNDAIGVAA